MASFSLYWEPSLILLPQYHYASPTSTHIYGAYWYGRWVETPHDDLLFFCKTVVQIAGGHSPVIRDDGSSVHATRYQLHHLLCSDMHGSSSGKYRLSKDIYL